MKLQPQPRTLKILLSVVIGMLAVLALLLVLLSTFDWNRAKPWLNEKVVEATERSFSINGDLSISWQRPGHVQSGWRSWVPWPHFRAMDVTLGNPEWATTGPNMAQVEQVDFTVNPFALLRKTIVVQSLLLTEPDLNLEQNKKGDNNWSFPKKEEGSPWEFQIQDLGIARGDVRYVDPGKQADAKVRIDTEDDGSVSWKLGGRFNDEKLSGNGKAGALLTLQDTDVRYPLEAEVKIGDTTITANGTITDPKHPSALDVELKILGASMADLFPVSGLVLPETPKFSTSGRIVGNLTRGSMQLRYEKFKGKVGTSDIAGTLEYVQQAERPLLRGEVSSNYLNFKDLSRLIGSGDDAKKKEGEKKQPPGKVLPVSQFKSERWDKMDVEVKFSGKKIERSEEWPIDSVNTAIRMDKGVLSLSPLSFGVAGGKLSADLTIDGNADPAKARMKISARKLQLDKLFPAVESMKASVGTMSGEAQLSAAGNSIAALLGSSNGELKALVHEGTISKFILEAMGLNLGSVVLTQLFGDEQVPLNCMAADFGIKDGLMQPKFFVVDTSEATIRVEGDINLAKEAYDLVIHPDSKGVRIFSLRSPLYVQGTFKNPDVGVDKGVLALKGGAAVALGALAAPLASLLALINPGPGEESPCAALIAQAKQKPTAPPPGKSAAK